MRLLKLLEEIRNDLRTIKTIMMNTELPKIEKEIPRKFADGNTAYDVNPKDVTHKRCKSCGRMLPIEKFGRCKNSPDGRFDYCFECHDNYIKNKCKELKEE